MRKLFADPQILRYVAGHVRMLDRREERYKSYLGISVNVYSMLHLRDIL